MTNDNSSIHGMQASQPSGLRRKLRVFLGLLRIQTRLMTCRISSIASIFKDFEQVKTEQYQAKKGTLS
jgi:hypothetical protein